MTQFVDSWEHSLIIAIVFDNTTATKVIDNAVTQATCVSHSCINKDKSNK